MSVFFKLSQQYSNSYCEKHLLVIEPKIMSLNLDQLTDASKTVKCSSVRNFENRAQLIKGLSFFSFKISPDKTILLPSEWLVLFFCNLFGTGSKEAWRLQNDAVRDKKRERKEDL